MTQRDLAEVLLRKAREDLATLQAVAHNKKVVDRIVGHLAQQAIEKGLRAVLTAAGMRAKRTRHNIDMALELLGERLDLPGWLDEARMYGPFAGAVRYAEVPSEPVDREAAVDLVERILDWASERVAEFGST